MPESTVRDVYNAVTAITDPEVPAYLKPLVNSVDATKAYDAFSGFKDVARSYDRGSRYSPQTAHESGGRARRVHQKPFALSAYLTQVAVPVEGSPRRLPETTAASSSSCQLRRLPVAAATAAAASGSGDGSSSDCQQQRLPSASQQLAGALGQLRQAAWQGHRHQQCLITRARRVTDGDDEVLSVPCSCTLWPIRTWP